MRKKLLLMILAGVLCLSLAGCGRSGETQPEEDGTVQTQEPAELPAEEPATEPSEEPAEEPAEGAGGTPAGGETPETPQYTDNFSVDAAAVTDFAKQIQAAVADKDLEALADLASYPLYVGFADGGQSVESREDFVALGADRIFTEELLSGIVGAETEGLEASMAGFSLSASGRPNVIFGVVDGRLAIVGMNY